MSFERVHGKNCRIIWFMCWTKQQNWVSLSHVATPLICFCFVDLRNLIQVARRKVHVIEYIKHLIRLMLSLYAICPEDFLNTLSFLLLLFSCYSRVVYWSDCKLPSTIRTVSADNIDDQNSLLSLPSPTIITGLAIDFTGEERHLWICALTETCFMNGISLTYSCRNLGLGRFSGILAVATSWKRIVPGMLRINNRSSTMVNQNGPALQ